MSGFFKDNPAVTADAYTQDALTSKNAAEAAKVASEAAKVASEAAQAAAETAEANAETAANSVSTDAATATTKAGESAASATQAASSASQSASSASSASASETAAASSATSASNSSSTAVTKSDESSTSATNAATSETNAAASASTSTTQAANAAASASTSTTQATNSAASAASSLTAKTAAETAETNAAASQSAAATSAAQSASSASQSASSASSASSSESNAASSATSASNSSSTATTKAGEAAASASNAATSESNASSSASTSTTQATNSAASAASSLSAKNAAETAETNAAASQSASASSATLASNSAATAATQAGTSATQAGNSATSATASSNSASSAASAQSAAEAARDSALAALDSFDDRYLGSKSSAPTVDNDGNALVSGALYFDSTSNVMKVYDGSQWLAAYASLAGALLTTNNLSDLNNAGTARTNLGLGTAATTASSDYATAAQADRTVSLSGSGATSISGTYPNFTVTSADTNTTYSVGDGGLTQNNFTTALKSKLDGVEASADVTDTTNVVAALTAGTNVTIASDGTVSSTNTNTTYSAGSGISLSGTTFSNSAPDQTVSLTGAGATTISGTYPNFTVTSVDTNTTYSVGDGGLTQNNFTNTLKSKLDGIEASANVTDTANVVGALTAGTNVTIASDGTISSTDTNTNTTYSAGSGISLSGTTFSNSAPDQTVALSGSGGTTVSGTYPNFTISSAASIDGTTINPSNIQISGAQGTDGQVLTSTGSGVAWEDSSNDSFTVNTFTANGSTTAFTLSTSPSSESNLMVFIEGVYQNAADFTLSGTTLTLDAAPPNGRKIVVYQISGVADAPSGGAWTHISTTNVTSAVSFVEVTLSGSYDFYVLRYSGWNSGTTSGYPEFQITTPTGSYTENVKYVRNGYGGDTSASTNLNAGTSGTGLAIYPLARTASANGSGFGEIHISNVAGMPSAHGQANIIDDDQSLDLGMTTFAFGFVSPSSSDKIGKIKIKHSYANVAAGKFSLYGIATS